tara:strand:+ start:17958 stop:19118 length:1161 start_codon:yes stop_codon:yes gene_type:complete
VLGAGAAGLFSAIESARRGRSVLVLDHASKPAEKIRISGGGRCNFTNLETHPSRFISQNPHFAKSALARFTPWDFIERMSAHNLTWHEKTLGQLFCDQKSPAIIQFLLDDLEAAGGELHLGVSVSSVSKTDGRFQLETSKGHLSCQSLIIATGGLSIPKIGASGFGYDLAKQFGHSIVETRPGLVPFTFSGDLKDRFAALSGVATPVTVTTEDKTRFSEAMLFTHRGLSGPAMLQASSYWQPGEDISIEYLPAERVRSELSDARDKTPKKRVTDWLVEYLPGRLTADIFDETGLRNLVATLSNADIDQLTKRLSAHSVTPTATEGYRTAEVTVGGVNTDELSSKTMESKLCPGLYFIGEVVDVTGWLGGYNFQWAWASAHAAGKIA